MGKLLVLDLTMAEIGQVPSHDMGKIYGSLLVI